jgi:hypothetical protein
MLTLPRQRFVNRDAWPTLQAYDPRGSGRIARLREPIFLETGDIMNKLLTTLLAAGFAALTFNAVAQTAPATPAQSAAPTKAEPAKATPATPAQPAAQQAKADKPKKAKAKSKGKKKAKAKGDGKSKKAS